jgi:hypothetical protein
MQTAFFLCLLILAGRVVDTHHLDADPDEGPDSTYHPNADPDADPDSTFHPDADSDLTYHPDANPDPDPSFPIKAQTLEKVLN